MHPQSYIAPPVHQIKVKMHDCMSYFLAFYTLYGFYNSYALMCLSLRLMYVRLQL